MTTPIVDGVVPWPSEFVERYTTRGWWTGRAIGDLLWETADRRADAVALVDGDLRITYAELADRADGAATRMAELGLAAGNRMVIQLPNTWHFVVLTLASLRRGVVPVMALPAHRRSELSYLVAHAEASALAVPDNYRGFDHQSLAGELRAEHPDLTYVLVAGEPTGDSVDLTALCAPAEDPAAERARWDAAHPRGSDVAVFLLSGVTTGLPKLIPRSHDDYAYNARAASEVSDLDRSSVYLVSLPASHNFPLACPGILGTLMVGGQVVLLPSPEPEAAFATIAREKVTHTAVVPAVASRWLRHREQDPSADLSSLRVLQVGGARMPDELARQVRPGLGATLQQVFGMAEGLLNYTRLDDPESVICTTQGRPLCPDDEIRLVDESDRPVPEGEPGSLLTRGPYTLRGYYRAPQQNADSFTSDGFYRTGDICRITAEGNLIVEGRVKDMINRAGEKISAEEVENLIYQLPGIDQVAAVAMPDDEVGERVCVYVVPSSGETVTLERIRESMEVAGMARFKLPERLILVGELLLTKVGKIDKKALRDDLAKRMSEGAFP